MRLTPLDDAEDVRELMHGTARAYAGVDAGRVVRDAARRGRRGRALRMAGAGAGGVAVATLVAVVAFSTSSGEVVTTTTTPDPASPARSMPTIGGAPPPVSVWQPTTPLSTRVDMSEGDKLRARAALLASDADSIGLVKRPDVDLVRWISPEEWAPTMLECTRGAGYPVSYTEDGGINSATVPSDQTPALLRAMHVCTAQYTVDPRFSEPLTREQRGIVYDYLTESYVPCLKGLDIEVSTPPSRTSYIATAEDDGWQPQLELPRGKVTEANATCPVRPRSDVLYGR